MFSFVKAAIVSAALATSAIATTGDAFYFTPGLGACGFTNTDDQLVASVSPEVFNSYPGATPSNPNNNPICQHSVSVTYQGTTIQVPIVDHFTATDAADNLGLSTPAFETFAPTSEGILVNIDWTIV